MVERWNIVFQKDISHFIFIINPVGGGPLISPRRRRYPYEPEANIALSQNPSFQL
jgi:hypothetical protein